MVQIYMQTTVLVELKLLGFVLIFFTQIIDKAFLQSKCRLMAWPGLFLAWFFLYVIATVQLAKLYTIR